MNINIAHPKRKEKKMIINFLLIVMWVNLDMHAFHQ